MAVKTINIMPTKSSPLSSNNPSMNKRWPPLADKSSLPYKLTTLSKQKLAREATAPDPDIRRCLGHFRMHCMSMEWAQRDMTTRINSIELESEEESESEDDAPAPGRPRPAADVPADNAAVKIEDAKDEKDPSSRADIAGPEEKETAGALHVHFEVSFEQSAPALPVSLPEEKEKEGLLEKGRNCLEKTVQRSNFWPSSTQCMPVRIGG
ncbi:hypothetical protein FE257_007525 [Aspergillus nanangensis]|uniref:Uncharacterized protein n=1 Tax=Aspergillus nanangensis TaxID=2582783 RepID=A0AAD4GTZ6_ASPNN|nr:hypothetical protein FE257_007525 [Aspergillus nanangensis]